MWCFPGFHVWELRERIGRVATYRCRKCLRTKTRIKGAGAS